MFHVLSAFLQICSEKKIKDITTKDITDHCGISRQTFYNYFRDKYEVMNYLFDEAAERATRPFISGNGPIKDTIKEMMDYALNNRSYFMSVASMEGQNSFEEYFCEYTIRYYEEYIMNMLDVSELPDELSFAVRFNSYAATRVFIEWIRKGMKESTEFLSSQVAECMPASLKTIVQSLQ